MIANIYFFYFIMSIMPNINKIIDLDEKVEELVKKIDMNINYNNIDLILDATDSVKHMWKGVADDNMISEGSKEAEIMKTYLLLIKEYEKWIKNLKKVI